VIKVGVPHGGGEAISDIAGRIFDGARCQRDLDARIGDFIAALHVQGWQTPTIGKVTWHDTPYTGGGIAIGSGPQHVVISGWGFSA
jgi:hypothetical protein